jgi:glutamine cyclotransferase
LPWCIFSALLCRNSTRQLRRDAQVRINDNGRAVKWVNEIEFMAVPGSDEGEVWGMIWQTECIGGFSDRSY